VQELLFGAEAVFVPMSGLLDEGFGITGLGKGSVRDTRKVTRKVSRMTGMIER
jgi:hypothetical protein